MEESRWSSLPGDILIIIAKRLDTQIDILRLRSVCHSWRSSIANFTHRPSSPLTLPFLINRNSHSHFTLCQSTLYFILPPLPDRISMAQKPWLFRAEELSNGKRRLLDPLLRMFDDNVSSVSPMVINLLDFPVFEIGRAFSLKSFCIKKVVVSSDPLTTGGDDFVIGAIQDEKLGFLRLGDEKWRLIDDCKQPDDIVYHKGKFYVVNDTGKTVVIGSDLKIVQVANSIPDGGGFHKYLAKFGEDLYLIDTCMNIEMQIDDDDVGVMDPVVEFHFNFSFYKLNEMDKKWDWIDSLGDKSFFLGDNCCFVVSAKDLVGLKPNCLYLLDDAFIGENEIPGDFFRCISVYNVEENMCESLATFESHSKIFWPPPSWLQSKRRSSKKEGA